MWLLSCERQSKKDEAGDGTGSSSKRAGDGARKTIGSAKTYLLFSQLLKEFDREDLENLWKLVKAKHGNTRPEEGYGRVLWGDLKISAAGTKVTIVGVKVTTAIKESS
ncbi:hypothetical protein Tco_0240881 [Tanacetum coccineum]